MKADHSKASICEKLHTWLKEWNLTPKILIGILLLAVLLGSTQFDHVNNLANKPRKVTLTVVGETAQGDSTFYILGLTERMLFERCWETVDGNEQWCYRTAEQMNASSDMLIWGSKGIGDQTEFTITYGKKLYMHSGRVCGTLSVSVDGKEIGVYDMYSESWGVVEIPLPTTIEGYGESVNKLVVYACIYSILFFLFCGLFIGFQALAKKKLAFFSRESDWFLCASISLIFLIYAIISYRSGLEHYMEFGDQLDYWAKVSPDSNAFQLARQGATFRGYLCQFIPLLMKKAGALIGRNPLYFWFAFNAVMAGLMLGYAFPGIYEVLVGKKATYGQTLLFAGIYSAFHISGMPWVGMDGVGVSAFFLGITFALKFMQKEKLFYAILSGAAFTAAVMFRSAYLYGIYGLLIAGAFFYFRAKKKSRHALEQGGISKIKPGKLLVGMAVAVMTMLVICIPQLVANIERGTWSPLPYPGPYMEYDSLTTYSASISLQGLFLGQPWRGTDAHIDNMIKYANVEPGTLDMPSVIYVYASNIHDTIIYIAKKLFVGFDNKFPQPYVRGGYSHNSQYAFNSFFNYIVMGTALYVLLFKSKEMTKKEKWLQIILFLTTILPLTLLHVEWRYYIVGYMLAYYLVAYRFVPSVARMRGKEMVVEMERYFLFLPCFVLLSQWASTSFFA